MGSGFRENHVLDNWKRIRRSDIEPCRVRINRHRDKSYTPIELLPFRSRGRSCYNGYCEQLFHLDLLFQFAAERQCMRLPTDLKVLDNSQARGTPETNAFLLCLAGYPIFEQLINVNWSFRIVVTVSRYFSRHVFVFGRGMSSRRVQL